MTLVQWIAGAILTALIILMEVIDLSDLKVREIVALIIFWPLAWLYLVVYALVLLLHGLWLLGRRVVK